MRASFVFLYFDLIDRIHTRFNEAAYFRGISMAAFTLTHGAATARLLRFNPARGTSEWSRSN